MNLRSFRAYIQQVDTFAVVSEHPSVPNCFRVRPSSPRYYDDIRAKVEQVRPEGVLVAITHEVEHFIPNAQFKLHRSLWETVKGWFPCAR